MNHTANYNLKKPLQSEYYDVDDFNDNADAIDGALKVLSDKIGSLSSLETEEMTSLVGAINEVWQNDVGTRQRIGTVAGDLDNLDTTAKTNLVAAINEIVGSTTTGANSLKIGSLLFQWSKFTANHTDAQQNVSFPTAYGAAPHIQLTYAKYADMFKISAVSSTILTIDASEYVSATGVDTSVDIYWFAIGTEATVTTTE